LSVVARFRVNAVQIDHELVPNRFWKEKTTLSPASLNQPLTAGRATFSDKSSFCLTFPDGEIVASSLRSLRLNHAVASPHKASLGTADSALSSFMGRLPTAI
jgi:hypothetical protein